jgi:hypothetical protein
MRRTVHIRYFVAEGFSQLIPQPSDRKLPVHSSGDGREHEQVPTCSPSLLVASLIRVEPNQLD